MKQNQPKHASPRPYDKSMPLSQQPWLFSAANNKNEIASIAGDRCNASR